MLGTSSGLKFLPIRQELNKVLDRNGVVKVAQAGLILFFGIDALIDRGHVYSLFLLLMV